MKCIARIIKCKKGFTLVEIIVTLVAGGILGAIFINLLGTALSESSKSLEVVRDEGAGVTIMEQIIADYVREINNDPANALATIIATDYGPNVSMQYITFDASGIEVISGGSTNTLKIIVQASGKNLTNILTNSRSSGDPLIRY